MLPIDPKDHIDDIHIPLQVSLGIFIQEENKDVDIKDKTHQILQKISKQIEESSHLFKFMSYFSKIDIDYSFNFISTFDKPEYLKAAEEVLKHKSKDNNVLEIVLNLSKKDITDIVGEETDIKAICEKISKEIFNMVHERLEPIKVEKDFKVVVSLTSLIKSGLTARRIMEIEMKKKNDALKMGNPHYFEEQHDKNAQDLERFNGLNKFYEKVIEDENSACDDKLIAEKIGEYIVNNSSIFIFMSEDNPYHSKYDAGKLGPVKKMYSNHWINPKSGCIAKELIGHPLNKYIKRVSKTIYWINSENGELNDDKGKDKVMRSIEHLIIFNREKLDSSKIEKKKKYYNDKFDINACKNKLPIEYIEPIKTYLVPYVSKASLLSSKYQRWDKWTNDLIYLLSILAVLVVTIQLIFSPTEILWIIFEVIFISVIFAILLASRKFDWHRKWIEYRFLSESLRSFPYLFLAEIDCGIDNKLPHLSRSREDWVEGAYEYIIGQFKSEECKLSFEDKDKLFEPLKNFILVSWISSQRGFYQRSCTKNMRKHKFFYYLSLLIFSLTLLFAIIHAGLMYMHFTGLELVHSSLILAVIILPAAGAAIGGLRIQKEYLRNWKRYENMAYHLSKLEDEIKEANDEDRLSGLIDDANDIMNLEHQDWRVTFSFHKAEPP